MPALGSYADAGHQRRLTASEQRWAAYRNAECAVEADTMRDGTLSGVQGASCATAMTTDHARTLRDGAGLAAHSFFSRACAARVPPPQP